MANISFYGSHNAAYVVEEDGKILMVLELERFLNYKNSGLAQYKCPKVEDIVFLSKYIPEYLMKTLNIKEFDTCIGLNTDVIYYGHHFLEKNIPAKRYIYADHHQSHAAGAFYQSDYQEALIFSFDGGGSDGKFNIYTCKRGESPNVLKRVINPEINSPHIGYDLGFPYMVIAHYLKDIKWEHLGDGNLTYPGKLMGLSSYGKVVDEWVKPVEEFFKSDPNGIDYHDKIKILSDKIGIELSIENRVEGQTAYDLAMTFQRVFEDCFLEIAKPFMEEYPDLPIIMTGGCALNILLNTRIAKEFNRVVFVPPDPNDCGIALGLMLNYIKPEKACDSTYLGPPLLDIDMLGTYVQNVQTLFKSYHLDPEVLVNDLIEGKIVGVARGRSEHGPRALGNRSIICDPTIPGMKDTLNEKVKHREWYRPFAPVVRLEDVNKYFEWDSESRWMSFCPKVREEWRDKLVAITHVDGTARVQTVTREQNQFLYDLLTLFEQKTGVGVLLNTSFNVDGKPILSSIQDAFTILENTKLDSLLIENYYLTKVSSYR